MRRVTVPLGARSYQIQIGSGLLANLGKECRKLKAGARCALITDANVAKLYGEAALGSLRESGFDPVLVTLPAGEKSKSWEMVNRCYQELAKHRLERSSFVVALGGGVAGDLAGFVAATYLRGIGFVQAPTSLLAQVDSSVGGKVGINLPAGKNLVGSFYQPKLVLCDLESLQTLPARELRAGLAEVIKYGIIYDPKLFVYLEKNLDSILAGDRPALSRIIARSCEIKAEVVGADETERGLRAILNYGHTIGHAIEAVFSYGKYLHGEAISIGQVAASNLSVKLLGLPVPEAARIRNLFAKAGLPVSIKLTSEQKKKVLNAMRLDKKVAGGEIKFVLARQIGKVEYGQRAPRDAVEAALESVSA